MKLETSPPPPPEHDKQCELLVGLVLCKCRIRTKPRHEGVESADLWSLKQHPDDQKRIDPIIDQLNEKMYEIDREQENLKKRLRP